MSIAVRRYWGDTIHLQSLLPDICSISAKETPSLLSANTGRTNGMWPGMVHIEGKGQKALILSMDAKTVQPS